MSIEPKLLVTIIINKLLTSRNLLGAESSDPSAASLSDDTFAKLCWSNCGAEEKERELFSLDSRHFVLD
jgi:hypothetical protein